MRHALDAKRIFGAAELIRDRALDVAKSDVGHSLVVEVEHDDVDRSIRAAPCRADARNAVVPHDQVAFPSAHVGAAALIDRLQLIHPHIVREGVNIEAVDAKAALFVPASTIDYDGLTSRGAMLCGRRLAQAQTARGPKGKTFAADDGVDDVRDEHARDDKHISGKRKPVA